MAGGGADTPMMLQYKALKREVPDALLLYRMGDFYELFNEDAREAASILELTLTSRNKQDANPIPMAGIPYHALDTYMKRLVSAGRKVAVAEQRAPTDGSKIMRRELVRVVTPGLPWDVDGIAARESCFLAAVCGDGPVGIAFLDATTGELRLTQVPDLPAAQGELARMEVRELVTAPELHDAFVPQSMPGVARSAAESAAFDPRAGRRTLCALLGVADLDGFGVARAGSDDAVGAAGALLSYARETARVNLDHVRRVRWYSVGGHLALDEATRRNLELVRPLRGTGRKGTLLGLLDRTCTPMGGRLLREWIQRPLIDPAAIRSRHDAVEELLDGRTRALVREHLRLVSDLERLGSKAAQGTANARDLVALGASLQALPGVLSALSTTPAMTPHLPTDLVDDVRHDITTWVVDEPPTSLTEGGLLRRGLDPLLDELVTLSREGKGAIAAVEARERQTTGINSLKIKHNKVFGYFIEVTQSNLDKVPADWIRKQTLANCERYITPELKEFEEKVLGADERRKALEYELFRALRDRVADQVGRLQALAAAVAFIDVITTFAELAVHRRYCRPAVNASKTLRLHGSRHPVVESMGMDERFVPNDIEMDEDVRLIILTGPNMAGKSTVMRQVALSTLMAQIGCFVPADAAEIGVCDRIFVRVGASDDLARGRSTFMVEMAETAHILNQATADSLILLDEIGRGTSTYDGLAIAWAVAEEVHDKVGARTIFATHYHEMVSLADDRANARNRHVAVSEHGDQIVFLRTLREGGASKSYGIQCARLAGMPPAVVSRARALLTELERRPNYGPPNRQLDLFSAPLEPAVPPPASPPEPPVAPEVIQRLATIDPDGLTPRAAHALLYELCALVSAPAEG